MRGALVRENKQIRVTVITTHNTTTQHTGTIRCLMLREMRARKDRNMRVSAGRSHCEKERERGGGGRGSSYDHSSSFLDHPSHFFPETLGLGHC